MFSVPQEFERQQREAAVDEPHHVRRALLSDLTAQRLRQATHAEEVVTALTKLGQQQVDILQATGGRGPTSDDALATLTAQVASLGAPSLCEVASVVVYRHNGAWWYHDQVTFLHTV